MTATIGPASTPAPGIAPAEPQDATAESTRQHTKRPPAATRRAATRWPSWAWGTCTSSCRRSRRQAPAMTRPRCWRRFKRRRRAARRARSLGRAFRCTTPRSPAVPNAELAAPKPKPPADMKLMENDEHRRAEVSTCAKAPGTDEKVARRHARRQTPLQGGHRRAEGGRLQDGRRPFQGTSGLPLPNRPSDWGLTARQGATAIVLGMRVIEKGNGFELANGIEVGQGRLADPQRPERLRRQCGDARRAWRT